MLLLNSYVIIDSSLYPQITAGGAAVNVSATGADAPSTNRYAAEWSVYDEPGTSELFWNYMPGSESGSPANQPGGWTIETDFGVSPTVASVQADGTVTPGVYSVRWQQFGVHGPYSALVEVV